MTLNEDDWDDQVSDASVGSDIDDDPIEEKSEALIPPTDDGVTETEDEEEREFNELPTMAEKWEVVMQLLITKKQVWVEDSQEFGGSEDAIALKPYLKKGLLKKDPRELSEPTMLHLLAKNFRSGGFASLDDSTQLAIFTYLMDNLVPEAAQAQAQAQTQSTSKTAEEPILKIAMLWKNRAFLLYIANNFEKEKLAPLINAKDGDGMNCLHYAFQKLLTDLVTTDKKIRSSQTPTTKTPTSVKDEVKIEDALPALESFIQASEPESIAAKDNKGNTPIHYAVHYNLCRYLLSKHVEYFDIVKSLVEKGDILLNTTLKENQFNNDGMSPYRYLWEMIEAIKNKRRQRDAAASSAAQKATKSRVPGAQESKTHKPEKVAERGKGDKLASGHESKGLLDKSHLDSHLVYDRLQSNHGHKDKDGKPAAAEAVLAHEANGHRATRGSTIRHDEVSVVQTVKGRSDDKPSMPIAGDDASKTRSDSRHRSQLSGPHGNTRLDAPQATPLSDKRENPEKTMSVGTILGWLKLHYIRTRPDMEAKELLYGKIASDKNLFFDAMHLAEKSGKDVVSAKDVVDLVHCLKSPGGFEGALSYVSLPVVSQDAVSGTAPSPSPHAANQGQKLDRKVQENVQLGRSSLITVFDALNDAGVRLILQLHVDDMQAPSHSDASIEKCLVGEDSLSPSVAGKANRRFKVELWNWKKPDLSVDVIRFAAPDVVQINLYWTGNHAVLRGWASPEGIPKLYVDSKKLRLVVLHVSPGIETLKRTGQLVKEFETKIQERTENGVEIKTKQWKPSTTAGATPDTNLSFGTGLPADEPRHDWISVMDKFRNAMYSIHKHLDGVSPQRVKVALIDDGVDRTNLLAYKAGQTDRGVVTGLSYWTSKDRNFLGWPWHQSTHGHGTIMASMIRRVNPWVFLMVMRIQDEGDRSSPAGGSIRIHAKSAARAIEDAIIREADIISMSWTIRAIVAQNSENTEDSSVTALREAIKKAADKGILMFCSASDNLQQSSTDSLPFSQAPNHIFRIGAAGLTGQRDGATEEHETINWFLPGKQVAEDFNPRQAQILRYHDGSSVATALAAGLASLVIYINIVMQELDTGTRETFANYAKWLRRDKDNMDKAFTSMTSQMYDRKYLAVWYKFGECADAILDKTKGVGRDTQVSHFERLVRSLCINVKEPRLQ